VAYLKESMLKDKAVLTKEERMTKAVAEATLALRQIAAENELSPQEISEQFKAGASRAAGGSTTNAVSGTNAAPAAATAPAPATATAPAAGTAPAVAPARDAAPATVPVQTNAPERVKSEYEKNLEQSVKGPDMPSAVPKDDIF
jgi:hypothetical protein